MNNNGIYSVSPRQSVINSQFRDTSGSGSNVNNSYNNAVIKTNIDKTPFKKSNL